MELFHAISHTRREPERYIRSGNLQVGSWCVQNDFFLACGEATFRNPLISRSPQIFRNNARRFPAAPERALLFFREITEAELCLPGAFKTIPSRMDETPAGSSFEADRMRPVTPPAAIRTWRQAKP